ncbi:MULTISPECIES: SRPBCC family protein [Arthrobacter]|uniref:SRPBCC family protein n=2 Tax=Arthrobacter TaxID=1663 RepID=A0ABU9KHT3_9MICC|nr:SRPBCC family protein [Arthrobacter sp. YJM1]MDP5226548.1 SRPBCC family protein [Arthrobacter sp. YJM1]
MSTFAVTRSAFIPAAPQDVFAHVNDFHQWSAWSPWEKLDADMSKSYSGPESGPGAHYEWAGKKAGTGHMTIEAATAPEGSEDGAGSIDIDLHFLKPFKNNNHTLFTFVPERDGTKVTWTMSGENKTLFSKAFAKLFSMDKMVGKDFESGLSALRDVATRG